MAKYAINREGVEALNQLANDLLIDANNIVETNQKLEQITSSLYDNLGIYGDEIISIIHRNQNTLNSNREDIISLSQRVKKQAVDIESLVAMGLGDGASGTSACHNNSLTSVSGVGKAIANVMPGAPMDFKEADSGHVNPNYGLERGYSINCQSCVVAFEARQRGYDVQVMPNTPGSMLELLSKDTSLAWIDPNTGKSPQYIYDDSKRTPEDYLDYIDSIVKPGERYTIQFAWQGRSNAGHIVNLDRAPNGLLRIKDNQRGEYEKSEWIGDFAVLDYLSRMKYENRTLFGSLPCVPRLIRIDNLDFNYDVVNQIMRS